MRLTCEVLEPRYLLSASSSDHALLPIDDSSSTLGITWMERFSVSRIPLRSLASVDVPLEPGVAGPPSLSSGEWIVKLRDAAATTVRRVSDAEALLDSPLANFTIISGLGDEGLLLVRGTGPSRADIESSLDTNPNVASFSLNQLIQAQETTPNDTEFLIGLMPSLSAIRLTEAWDRSIGSTKTVVGVLDTGIDLDHRDLYLNIWFNQGEIPDHFLDDDGNQLTDIDQDGLITFYDLNHATREVTAPFELNVAGFTNGPNAEFVRDLNDNGYIDGLDILADPLWADGRDTDVNGEVDDFFGANFRGDGVPNNPSDGQGHGTHVAGTIGAIGGNGIGVTGVNWQTSLMPLRILDNSNQGDIGSAIRAVNYARQMRERFEADDSGRVIAGANVRVLNNSWGQPGGYEEAFDRAIDSSGDAGILFVAAAGNGNFLGQGVDNDRTPFYPANYQSNSVVAVAASNSLQSLAPFSNFGDESVDIAAPGVGIRSTELGGAYSTRNGTSMAVPHVAGTAALIWSALPEASVDEVRRAILFTATQVPTLVGSTVTSGVLDSSGAVKADVFAPAARLVSRQNITNGGGSTAEFTIEYSHRNGIDVSTIGDNDLVVTRQWGDESQIPARLKGGTIVESTTTVTATYFVEAPGGIWDPLDFGDYVITTRQGSVSEASGDRQLESRTVGRFSVRIDDDPSILYVTRPQDGLEAGTLRSAILAANASARPSVIILEQGTYSIQIPPVIDSTTNFPEITSHDFYLFGPVLVQSEWSSGETGDFVIEVPITIVGDTNQQTTIDAGGLDRIFRVAPGGSLSLRDITLQNGVAERIGGAILALGDLELEDVIVRNSRATAPGATDLSFGGGVAALRGNARLNRSWITGNQSSIGGGVHFGSEVTGEVERSTIDHNTGGGLQSISRNDVQISNSTFSSNTGGNGAVAKGVPEIQLYGADASISGDGRYLAFGSPASNLVPGDSNGTWDVFVYDRQTGVVERISVSSDGDQSNGYSELPTISRDGRYLAFASLATNLVPASAH